MVSRQLRPWILLAALAAAAACELNPQPPIPTDGNQGSIPGAPDTGSGGTASTAGATSAGTSGGAVTTGGSLALDSGGEAAETPVNVSGGQGAGGDNAAGTGGDNTAGNGG